MNFSDRINRIETSRTARFIPLIQKLQDEGREIINLAVGEPSGDTLPEIIESTKKALDEKKTKYSAVPGIPELKTELSKIFEGYGPDNIIVSNGSKQSLFSIFQVICNPGDEVIIPRPCWVSFSQQVLLAGGKPVFVDTKNHQLDCEGIKKAITPETRAILINSPNNPTGAVYPKKDLEKVAQLSLEHEQYVISDEAYYDFVYDGLNNQSIFMFADAREKLIITRSFSKGYNMTGFRIGYIAAHVKIIKAVERFQSHATGNVCTFAQYGGLAALSVNRKIVLDRQAKLEKKRDIAYQHVCKTFKCIKPQGGFYLFPDISNKLKPGETSENFAGYLLENAGVAVVPGEAFSMDGHIRISYAVSEDILISGLEKIEEVL